MANDQDPVFEWVLRAYGTIKRGLIDAFADWSQSKKSYRKLPSSAVNLMLLSLRRLSRTTASFSAAPTFFLGLVPIICK